MGREDLIKIFENTVWMCETNHKLKDKIKNSMAFDGTCGQTAIRKITFTKKKSG